MQLKWSTCFKVFLTGFALFLSITYWKHLVGYVGIIIGSAAPLFIGFMIAYVINILMSLYERCPVWKSENKVVKAIKRPFCMLLAFASVLLLVFLLIRMIIPELISCVKVLIEKIPVVLLSVSEYINAKFDINLLAEMIDFDKLQNLNVQETLGKVGSAVFHGFSSTMGSVVNVVSSVFSSLVTIVVAIVFSIYMLLDKEKLSNQLARFMKIYLSDKNNRKMRYVGKIFNESFHNFIVGQCVEAVILGLLTAIGMWVLKLPYASMIGCLIGFTALIPVAGGYIGAAFGAIMIVTVDPWKAVVFLVFLIILQQIEGNVIYPKVVGSSIGLPGIWVLLAVMVGGGIFGIGGMLIGVPTAAAIYKLIRNDMRAQTSGQVDGFEDIDDLELVAEIMEETKAEFRLESSVAEVSGVETSDGEEKKVKVNKQQNSKKKRR